MPFSVIYDESMQAIIVLLTGRISIQLIGEAAREVARVCRETGCRRILNNASEADTSNLSVMDVYSSPSVLEECGIPQTTKRALVVPVNFVLASFLEDVTHNKGHYFKIFWNLDTAIHWLCGSEWKK